MIGREWTAPRILSFASCATLTVACAGDEQGQARVQADMDPVRSGIVVDYEPLVRLGWLPGEPLFGRVVDGVVLDDSTAVVLDAQRSVVTWLFADGRSMEVGGIGGGPGEFAQLHAVVRLPDGAVAIQDAAQGRLTVVESGEVSETLVAGVLTQATLVGMTGDGRWITGPPMTAIPIPAEPGWVSTPVLAWDRSFVAADTLLVLDYADMSVPTPFPFEGMVAANEEHLAVATSNEPRVEWRDMEGQVIGSRELELEPAFLNDDIWDRHIWGVGVRLAEGLSEEQLTNMLAPQRAAAAERLPFLGSLWFDQDGRVWVGRYAPDFWHPEEYVVVTPNGEPPVHVTIPERVQILDAGEGMFLAVERDALGVEAVSLYSFEE